MAEAPKVTDNTAKRQFEVCLGEDVAFAEYRLTAGRMELPHTVVPTALEGQGVASALARHAFAEARARGHTVVPTCAFMVSWIKKHPEAQDIVDPSCKAELGIA